MLYDLFFLIKRIRIFVVRNIPFLVRIWNQVVKEKECYYDWLLESWMNKTGRHYSWTQKAAHSQMRLLFYLSYTIITGQPYTFPYTTLETEIHGLTETVYTMNLLCLFPTTHLLPILRWRNDSYMKRILYINFILIYEHITII